MIRGNIEKFKGTGLVAFIDILGFSKEIEEHWDDQENNPLDKILSLKNNLPTHLHPDIAKIDPESSTISYVCRVQTVSDSIVISFGFEEKMIYGDIILGTIAFFDTIALIWRNALEAGFTIRGAADFGSIYWDDKEIIGPAFIKVYRLEQTHAKTSRVIISSAFNQNLRRIFDMADTFWNKSLLNLLATDNDGYLIINPHRLYADEPDRIHVIQLLEKLRNKAKGLNAEKYSPILAILNNDSFKLNQVKLGAY